MSGLIIPLLRDAYPAIRFVTHEEMTDQRLAETAYATYCLGLFFDDKENIWQPTDFRHVGLHRTAAYILGVDPAEQPAVLRLPDESRPIAEPYVCIAVQASSGCKYWNNPQGWREVVGFLKARGYRVVCIDQKPVHGTGLMWTHIPHGAEDLTGDLPLADRARWLRHAAFFVGLSSGLSWPCLGGRLPGCPDQRLHPPDQRVHHAVPGEQLARLQQLLERSRAAVRPQGFFLVPAPRRHAAPVRMHAAHHRRAGDTDDFARAGPYRPAPGVTRSFSEAANLTGGVLTITDGAKRAAADPRRNLRDKQLHACR